MLPAVFDLRLRKWDTLVRFWTSPLSFSFMSQQCSLLLKRFSLIAYNKKALIDYDKNYFQYRWGICRLSFNQVTIIVVFMYCCFIVIFIRGGLFMSDSINSMIIIVVISYVIICTTSYVRLGCLILNYSTTLMVK